MRRTRFVGLCLALLCAACGGGSAGGGGGSDAFDDYCALAGLPARTASDLQLLQRHSAAAQAHHRGKVVGDAATGAAIVRAALELDLAIPPALAELQAIATADEPPSGTPPTLASVTRAQAELRAACPH